MTDDELQVGDEVVYWAPHAGPTVQSEHGIVTSIGRFGTFVRFDGTTTPKLCVGGSLERAPQ